MPGPGAVELITGIYAALLAEERRHDRSPDTLEAGSRLMAEVLTERGQTYEEFVWSVTP